MTMTKQEFKQFVKNETGEELEDRVNENPECQKCGGEMAHRSAGDESYRRCGDCGNIDMS